MRQALRIASHDCLISPDSGVVVDIPWFGQSDHRVDEDVGSMLSSGSNGEFSVSSMHGVTSLESGDLAPGEFVKVCSELGRGV